MFCKYCGTQLKDEARFCPTCGREVPQHQQQMTQEMPQSQIPQQEKKKSDVWIWIAAAVVVVIVAAGVLFVLPSLRNGEDSQIEDTTPSQTVENTEQDTPETTQRTEPEATENTEQEELDTDTDTQPEQDDVEIAGSDDYSTVLDPMAFATYSGHHNGFSFCYPEGFYQHMEKQNDEMQETVHFYTDNSDSEAWFTWQKRTDGVSRSAYYQSLYQEYWNDLYHAEKILAKEQTDDGGSRFIVTGYADGRLSVPAYHLVYITDEAVMEMYITYPFETSAEDKNEKWYYVECMYRMCGFSGSARSPRSFQEYLKNS